MPQCWSPGASHPTPLCSEPRNSCCHGGRLAISSLLEVPLCSSCPLSALELGSLTFRKQFTVSKALSCPLLNSSWRHSPTLRAVSRGGTAPLHRREDQGPERMSNSPPVTRTVRVREKTGDSSLGALHRRAEEEGELSPPARTPLGYEDGSPRFLSHPSGHGFRPLVTGAHHLMRNTVPFLPSSD